MAIRLFTGKKPIFLVERTTSGYDLHGAIIECAAAISEKVWRERIAYLDKLIWRFNTKHHGQDPFVQVSTHGITHLHDVVHLTYSKTISGHPPKEELSPEVREERTLFLFKKLVEGSSASGKDALEELALAITDDDFTLLQESSATRRSRIMREVFSFVRGSVKPDLYMELLQHHAKGNWNLFHTAGKSKRDVFDFLIREFELVFNSKAEAHIEELLTTRNYKGDTPLCIAMNTSRASAASAMRSFLSNGLGGGRG